MTRTLVIPAAGMGTRLRSSLPKLLTPVAGRPMIAHVLDRLGPYCEHVVLVVHPSAHTLIEEYCASAGMHAALVDQAQPTGMLDAIVLAGNAVRQAGAERVWICWCDQVLLSKVTVDRMAAREAGSSPPAAVFPTARMSNPYIHFDRDPSGRLIGVRQRRENDEMPEPGEADSGLFALSAEAYAERLTEYSSQGALGRATGERNFLPFLPWLAARAEVATVEVGDIIETRGINTPEDLQFAESHLMRTRVEPAS